MRLATGALAAALALAAASCRKATAPEGPVVRLVAHDFTFDVPASLPAGIVHLRLVNEGSDMHEAILTRMTSDAGTAERYVEQWKAGNSWPDFAADVGGTGLTMPGDSSDAWVRLIPGRYVVICTKGDHLDRGMAMDLIVRAGPTITADSTPPAADLELGLVDYAFTFPDTVRAGAHRIHVTNRGTEPHEMDILHLSPGKEVADWIAWAQGGEAGMPPLTPVGGGGDIFPGGEVWMSVNLPPGRYAILCAIRQGQHLGGTPHHALGMLHVFAAK